MIKIRTSDNTALIIEQERDSPVIYLDLCVLEDISGDDNKRNKLIKALKTKNGTLLLSWTHLIEMFGMDPQGHAFCSIQRLLESVENHWGILEGNAFRVIEKEKSWMMGKQSPAFDEKFANEIFSQWRGLEIPTPALALKELQRNTSNREKYTNLCAEFKTKFKALVDKKRCDYRSSKEDQKKLDAAKYEWHSGTPPTEFICNSLLREVIKTNDEFRLTDGPDFSHVVVSTAYADLVIFDKKWVRRLKEIILPHYSETKVYNVTELDCFLDDLETYTWKL